MIIGFLRSPRWKTPVMSFIDEYCTGFDDEDEHKLEFTKIHNVSPPTEQHLVYNRSDLLSLNDAFLTSLGLQKDSWGFASRADGGVGREWPAICRGVPAGRTEPCPQKDSRLNHGGRQLPRLQEANGQAQPRIEQTGHGNVQQAAVARCWHDANCHGNRERCRRRHWSNWGDLGGSTADRRGKETARGVEGSNARCT